MRNRILIAAVGGALLSAAFVPSAHAQDSQTSTTETTTTTTQPNMPPPPPPPMGQMSTTTTESTVTRNGYASFGYRPDNMAARNGYNDGYDKGISDFQAHHGYSPQNTHLYNHPAGYLQGPMPKSEYYHIYKEAFLHGYEKGYKSSAGQ